MHPNHNEMKHLFFSEFQPDWSPSHNNLLLILNNEISQGPIEGW